MKGRRGGRLRLPGSKSKGKRKVQAKKGVTAQKSKGEPRMQAEGGAAAHKNKER